MYVIRPNTIKLFYSCSVNVFFVVVEQCKSASEYFKFPGRLGRVTKTVNTNPATNRRSVFGLLDFGSFAKSFSLLSFCRLLHHLARAGRAHKVRLSWSSSRETNWAIQDLSSLADPSRLILGCFLFTQLSNSQLSFTGGHSVRYSLSLKEVMSVSSKLTPFAILATDIAGAGAGRKETSQNVLGAIQLGGDGPNERRKRESVSGSGTILSWYILKTRLPETVFRAWWRQYGFCLAILVNWIKSE